MAKTIDEVLNNIRTTLQDQSSNLASFPDYGNLYMIFRALASVIVEQDSELDTIYESLFINTTNNQELDQRAKEYGLIRRPGAKAYGSVLVEFNQSNSIAKGSVIKRGTILLNPFTNKQYVVLNSVSITIFRTNLEIESLEPSSDSNVVAGTKLISNFYKNFDFIVADSFNQLTNQYEGGVVGGSEAEDDISLRNRILEVVRIKQSSTFNALESAARSVRGVKTVLIEENVPSPGYITIYVDNTNFDVLNEVKLRAQDNKPLGILLYVKPIQNIPINIELNISLYSKDNLVNKNSNINGLITNYINKLEKTFTRESLAGLLLNNRYIENVQVISPTSSLTIVPKQKFIPGSINIQYI